MDTAVEKNGHKDQEYPDLNAHVKKCNITSTFFLVLFLLSFHGLGDGHFTKVIEELSLMNIHFHPTAFISCTDVYVKKKNLTR